MPFPSLTLPVFHCRLDPYADPYYDYEIERFWRGGQYENFRVQYTDPDPYRNYRVSKETPPSHPFFLPHSLPGSPGPWHGSRAVLETGVFKLLNLGSVTAQSTQQMRGWEDVLF